MSNGLDLNWCVFKFKFCIFYVFLERPFRRAVLIRFRLHTGRTSFGSNLDSSFDNFAYDDKLCNTSIIFLM